MARHVGRLKLGSKPAQLYVRLCIRPLGQQAYHVAEGIIRYYLVTAAAAAFICLHFFIPYRIPESSIHSKSFALCEQQPKIPSPEWSTPYIYKVYLYGIAISESTISLILLHTLFFRLHTHTHTHIYIYIYIIFILACNLSILVYIYIYIYIYLCVCVCVCVNTYNACWYKQYIYICVCVCMYVCVLLVSFNVYIYIYIYIYTFGIFPLNTFMNSLYDFFVYRVEFAIPCNIWQSKILFLVIRSYFVFCFFFVLFFFVMWPSSSLVQVQRIYLCLPKALSSCLVGSILK